MTSTFLTLAMTLAAEPPGPPIDTSFLRQYAETRGFMLGRPVKPKITPDGKAVLFLRSGPTSPKQSLFEFDVATKQTKELLSPDSLLKGADENLSPEEKARRERQRVSAGGFADYFLDEAGKRVLVSLSGKLFVLDRGTGKTTELKTGPGPCIDPKWSPDGLKIAYVRGHDVYVFDLPAGTESAVTTGGTPVVTHGLAEFVAQEEMHRHTGYWWSPDSKFIAYEEADHTGVEVWYPSDPAKPDAAPVPQYYPRPGKKNVAVRLGIVPVTGAKTVWVDWDRAKYEYLNRVAWGRGALFLAVQSRDQKEVGFAFADPETGTVEVTHRTRAKEGWVGVPGEPQLGPIGDGKTFTMIADNEKGEPKLNQLDRTGEMSVLSAYDMVDLVAVSKNNERVYVASRLADEPTSLSLVSFRFGEPNSPFIRDNHNIKPGVHTGVVSDDETILVITSTSLNTMPITQATIEVKRGLFTQNVIPSIAMEPMFDPQVIMGKVGDYYSAVVRPRQFDPNKKYPVIVDVYGGPGHLHVIHATKNWLIPQWLADQGFIVVAIDNRGTPGRGRDWERAIYQKFGTVPLEDQVKGLQALGAKHPELDLTRVGIVGWSFGGYMAANAVLRRPDVFHAAVAGAPVTDWEDYDTHYTERYLGLLPESKKVYDEASLIPLAKNLSRPLLLVHGTADDNVFYRHTLKLSDALFRAGKPFEVLPLPGITHMYAADPQVAERLWERNVTFFRQHLGGPK
jgi:dipeptidyl-peptidase-4